MQTLFDAAPLAIMAVDWEGRVIRWNPAAAQIFGWSEGEVLGQFSPVIPSVHEGNIWPILARHCAGDSCAALELSARRKDGSHLAIRLSSEAATSSGPWQ